MTHSITFINAFIIRLVAIGLLGASVAVACTTPNDTPQTNCRQARQCEGFVSDHYPIEQLSKGQSVIHCRYGKGIVQVIEADIGTVQVRFIDGSERWFVWAQAPFKVDGHFGILNENKPHADIKFGTDEIELRLTDAE